LLRAVAAELARGPAQTVVVVAAELEVFTLDFLIFLQQRMMFLLGLVVLAELQELLVLRELGLLLTAFRLREEDVEVMRETVGAEVLVAGAETVWGLFLLVVLVSQVKGLLVGLLLLTTQMEREVEAGEGKRRRVATEERTITALGVPV
jgi:hypothetical protein